MRAKPTEFPGHKGAIYTLLPVDNQTFLSAGSDGWVVQWKSDNPTEALALIQAGAPIFCLAPLPNNQFAIGTGKGQVHILDRTEKKEIKNLQLHDGNVYQLRYIQALDIIYSTGNDGVLNLISRKDFSISERFQFGLGKIRASCVHNELIYLGFESGDIIGFDALEGAVKHKANIHELGVTALCSTPFGIVSGAKDAHLYLLSDDLQVLDKVPAHNYAIYQIEQHPETNRLVTASRDKSIKLWQIENHKVVFKEKIDRKANGHAYSVNTAVWLNDTTFLSAGDDRKILMWDL